MLRKDREDKLGQSCGSQGRLEYHTTTKIRKVNWIGHILHRNYLLKHITEGKVEERK